MTDHAATDAFLYPAGEQTGVILEQLSEWDPYGTHNEKEEE